jgi:hypothetical protein
LKGVDSMLQTKRKIAAAIAAVATIFSALVVATPAQATVSVVTPNITDVTFNSGTLEVTVGSSSGGTDRTHLNYQYRVSGGTWASLSGTTWTSASASSESASKSSLTVDKIYEVKVQAKYDNGVDAPSYSSWDSALTAVPGAPVDGPSVYENSATYDGQGTSTTSDDTSVIHVSFTEDSDLSPSGSYEDAQLYVYKDGSTTALTPIDVTGTSHDYIALVGHTYSFKVKTHNGSGYSALSPSSDIITTVDDNVNGTLTGVTVTVPSGLEFGNGEVRASWSGITNTVASATRVKIQYKAATVSSWTASSGVNTVYADYADDYFDINSANLVPGTAYNFRLSVSSSTTGTYTYGAIRELASTVTPLTVPGPVSGIVASPDDSKVTLTWVAPANNGGSPVTAYQVDYKDAAATGWSGVASLNVSGAVVTATITGLVNGNAYRFRIRAISAVGTDAVGLELATAVTPQPLPGGPLNLVGSAANSSVTLSWSAPEAADLHGQTVTDYKVEYKASTASTWSTFAHTASAATSATVSGLANGVAYNFRVSTKTSAGYSAATVAAAAVTPTNSLGTPSLDPVAISLSPGSVSVLDNQSNVGASGIPTAVSGAFSASGVGLVATFKSLDSLGFALPLNSSNQLVLYAGRKVGVSATGFKPGSRVRLYVVGNSSSIGTTLANATGTVGLSGVLPATLAKGNVVLQLNGSSTLNNRLSVSIGATSTGALLVTSKSVKFAVGSTTLTSTEKHKLRELVNSTSLAPLALRVVANTYKGATKTDLKRATSRAKAVAKYLKTLGVAATFTTVKNTGKAKSLSTARNVVVTFDIAGN